MKKLLALILAAVMIFSLAACAQKPAQTATEPEASAADAPTETAFGFYNQPGDYAGELPFAKEGENNKLTVAMIVNSNVEDYETNDYTKWLEEKTGVDLDFQIFTGSSKENATQLALMITGGEKLPDIMFSFSGVSPADMREYGEDGYFADLREYMAKDAYYTDKALHTYYPTEEEYNFILDQINKVVVDPDNGCAYSWPLILQGKNDTNIGHTWINQVWLDKLGLKMPTNVQELHDVLVAFRDQDPNGNGIKDEIPMLALAGSTSGRDTIAFVINAFTYYDNRYTFYLEDGKVQAPFAKDEYREALCYLKQLVDEGLLSTLSWTCKSADIRALLNPEDGVQSIGFIMFPGDVDTNPESDCIYELSPMKPLADATGKGGHIPVYCDEVNYYGAFVSADCENVELAVKLLDFMMSPESYLFQRWAIQGENWDYYDKPGNTEGMLGGEAKIENLTEDTTFFVNNYTWHTLIATISSEQYWQRKVDFNDGSWQAAYYSRICELIKNYDAAGAVDGVLYNLGMNGEETAQYNEANTDIRDFVKTALCEFCTGVKDPGSDTDWNNYLQELESYGYTDTWLAAVQACCDRTK